MTKSKKSKGPKPPRRVLIATPVAADASLSIYYVDSLTNSFRLTAQQRVELYPVYMANDVLVQRARNSLIAIAIEAQVDDLIWIDSDIQWQPDDIFRLLNYPVDVVGGTYRKKTDEEEQYPIQIRGNSIPIDPSTGLLEVDGLGTGMLRMSKKALQAVWNDPTSKKYRNKGNIEKWICEILLEPTEEPDVFEVISEDIVLCHKLAALGFKIYLDPLLTCNHVGQKVYQGNFAEYLVKLQKANA